MYNLKHAFIVTTLVISSFLFIGCSIVQHKSYTSQTSSGPALAQGKIDKIEPGVTTKASIIDAFGLPTTERDFGDGNEVLEYLRSYRTENMFSLLLVFTTENVKKSDETLIIDLKDGIVQKYWLE
jgi:hypothetical protein